jgi:hypothetical protein
MSSSNAQSLAPRNKQEGQTYYYYPSLQSESHLSQSLVVALVIEAEIEAEQINLIKSTTASDLFTSSQG